MDKETSAAFANLATHFEQTTVELESSQIAHRLLIEELLQWFFTAHPEDFEPFMDSCAESVRAMFSPSRPLHAELKAELQANIAARLEQIRWRVSKSLPAAGEPQTGSSAPT